MLPVSGALQLKTSGAIAGAAHQLGQRRVVDVGQPLAAVGAEPRGVLPGVLLRQEEVPQPLRPGLGLELLEDRQRLPRVAGTARLGQVAVVAASTGVISSAMNAATRAVRSAARGDGAKSMARTLVGGFVGRSRLLGVGAATGPSLRRPWW